MTFHALPARIRVGADITQLRAVLAASRRASSAVLRQLHNEGWNVEIQIIREEHKIDDDLEFDFAHYHALATHDAEADWLGFQERFQVLWTRSLRKIQRNFSDLFPCSSPRKAYLNAEWVRKIECVSSYLVKPPSLPVNIDPKAALWLHRLIENASQLRCFGSFKAWRSRQGRVSKKTHAIVTCPRGEPFYLISNPKADRIPQVERWRRRMAVVDRLSYLEPRAAKIYGWVTHEDEKYRSRLRVSQEVLDDVCEILGRTRIIVQQKSSMSPLRSSHGQRAAGKNVDWHGAQRCVVKLCATDPPF